MGWTGRRPGQLGGLRALSQLSAARDVGLLVKGRSTQICCKNQEGKNPGMEEPWNDNMFIS
eukprot:2059612-Amphidinium_carterae.1